MLRRHRNFKLLQVNNNTNNKRQLKINAHTYWKKRSRKPVIGGAN